MSFKKLFLPVGLILAITTALIEPRPGIFCKEIGMIPWLVVLIFLVNGYQLQLKDFSFNRKFILAFVVTALLSLAAASFISGGIVRLLPLPTAMALGLVVMSTVPPTLSSCVVITEVAGGNTLWALFLTVGINLLGPFTIPFILEFNLGQDLDIAVAPLPLLFKLLRMVLLPFVIGNIIRCLSTKFDVSKKLTYIPSTCVILTVWAAVAAYRESVFSIHFTMLLLALGGGAAVHLILLLGGRIAAWLLKLDHAEMLPVLLVSSQKTLPVAITV